MTTRLVLSWLAMVVATQQLAADSTIVHVDAGEHSVITADGEYLLVIDPRSAGNIQQWSLRNRRLARTLRLPTSDGTVVAASADSQTVAAGTESGTIIVWNAGKQVAVLKMAEGGSAIHDLIVSAKGRLIASFQGRDGSLRVWDVAESRLITTYSVSNQRLVYAAFNANENSILTIFDLEAWHWTSGRQATRHQLGDRQVLNVIPSADDKLLLLSMADKAELWSASPLQRLEELPYAAPLTALFLRDAKHFLIRGLIRGNASVDVWDLQPRPHFERSLTGEGEIADDAIAVGAGHVAFTADNGEYLALMANTDLSQVNYIGKDHRRSIDNVPRIKSLAFCPDGSQVVSVNEKGLLQFWEVSTGRLASQLGIDPETTGGAPKRIAFVGDGATIALVSDDGRIDLVDASGGRFAPRVITIVPPRRGNEQQAVLGLDVSPDGTYLALRGTNAIWLYETASGKQRATVPRPAVMFGFSRTGTDLRLIGSTNQSVYDLRSGVVRDVPHPQEPGRVDLGPPAPRMMLGQFNHKDALWDSDTGHVVATFIRRSLQERGQQQVSPDGTLFAVVAKRQSMNGVGLEVFDVLTGQPTTDLPLNVDSYNGLGFSSDRTRILISTDKSIVFVDFQLGRVERAVTIDALRRRDVNDIVPGGFNPGASPAIAARDQFDAGADYAPRLTGIAVSAKLVAIGSSVGDLWLLSYLQGELVAYLPHPLRPVSLLRFSDDGAKLFYVIDGTAYMMDVPNGAPR